VGRTVERPGWDRTVAWVDANHHAGAAMKLSSFRAVVAGVLFIIVVTTLVDMLLHAVKVFPPMNQPLDDRLSLIASAYRLVIGVAGGWITARLAPRDPMKHALILGFVGTVLGLVGMVATWNLGLGPRWYPISLAVLAIPQCWAGGRLFEMGAGRR
jgi:hypothetical protein